jgi:hypothetical protein
MRDAGMGSGRSRSTDIVVHKAQLILSRPKTVRDRNSRLMFRDRTSAASCPGDVRQRASPFSESGFSRDQNLVLMQENQHVVQSP